MKPTAAIILAAGAGTRMITDLPKVLHEVCGRPMLAYVHDACRSAGITRIIDVVGYRQEEVRRVFADETDVTYVVQAEQNGTGHAVAVCAETLADFDGNCVVLCGDGPLIRPETISALIEKHEQSHSVATLATAVLDDPTGYGRIVRDAYGNLEGIVEHSDCTDEQREIKEVNPSYYCFDARQLFAALAQLKPDNVKGEYYLTDALQILIGEGKRAAAITSVQPEDVLSINSRQQLAVVSKMMQHRIQDRLMSEGVSIVDPDNTWIDARACIGKDTIIRPFTYIHGRVRIGERCSVGPFSYLRDESVLADDVVVGVFTELKSTTLGTGTRTRHLSYLGDATVGEHVNVRAGTIVANFDGENVHKTTVENNAYIGSGSILVAPLTVAAGTQVDPGSVIQQNNTTPVAGDA
jgi:bifunctional UDP-N-acetylglucosamine pyrophosphorylase/glucosamine-1-phosphate N-acetyltransferase